MQPSDPHETSRLMEVAAEVVVVVVHRTSWFVVQQQPWAVRVMSQGLCDMRGGETTKPQDHSQNWEQLQTSQVSPDPSRKSHRADETQTPKTALGS